MKFSQAGVRPTSRVYFRCIFSLYFRCILYFCLPLSLSPKNTPTENKYTDRIGGDFHFDSFVV